MCPCERGGEFLWDGVEGQSVVSTKIPSQVVYSSCSQGSPQATAASQVVLEVPDDGQRRKDPCYEQTFFPCLKMCSKSEGSVPCVKVYISLIDNF